MRQLRRITGKNILFIEFGLLLFIVLLSLLLVFSILPNLKAIWAMLITAGVIVMIAAPFLMLKTIRMVAEWRTAAGTEQIKAAVENLLKTMQFYIIDWGETYIKAMQLPKEMPHWCWGYSNVGEESMPKGVNIVFVSEGDAFAIKVFCEDKMGTCGKHGMNWRTGKIWNRYEIYFNRIVGSLIRGIPPVAGQSLEIKNCSAKTLNSYVKDTTASGEVKIAIDNSGYALSHIVCWVVPIIIFLILRVMHVQQNHAIAIGVTVFLLMLGIRHEFILGAIQGVIRGYRTVKSGMLGEAAGRTFKCKELGFAITAPEPFEFLHVKTDEGYLSELFCFITPDKNFKLLVDVSHITPYKLEKPTLKSWALLYAISSKYLIYSAQDTVVCDSPAVFLQGIEHDTKNSKSVNMLLMAIADKHVALYLVFPAQSSDAARNYMQSLDIAIGTKRQTGCGKLDCG
jgi:hypothetical protein